MVSTFICWCRGGFFHAFWNEVGSIWLRDNRLRVFGCRPRCRCWLWCVCWGRRRCRCRRFLRVGRRHAQQRPASQHTNNNQVKEIAKKISNISHKVKINHIIHLIHCLHAQCTLNSVRKAQGTKLDPHARRQTKHRPRFFAFASNGVCPYPRCAPHF